MAVAILLLFLTGAFFYKCLFLGLALVPADILTYFYPWKLSGIYPGLPHNPFLGDGILGYYPLISFVHELFRKGIPPLWNPYLYCGTPLLGSNDAFVFSPVSLFAFFMPVYKAITLYIILQIFFSGFFMYLFLKKGLGLDRFSSLVGAVVFMFNGHFVAWLTHIGFAGVLMWLPLVFFLIERMVLTRRIIYALFAGLILGGQFYCGFLQVSYYLFLGCCIYGLIRIFQEYFKDKKALFILLFYLSLVFIIGLCIGAVQLLPSLELIRLSHRQAQAIPFYLFNPACALALLTFVFPDIFGNPIHNNYWGPANYVELCAYIGIIPLLLLLAAARHFLKDKRVFALSVIALFSLGVYLQTPLNSILYLLPGYNRDISTVRVVCLYVFSASCLAGLGLEYVKRLDLGSLARLKRNIFIGFLTVLLLYLAVNFLIQTNKDYILRRAAEVVPASTGEELVDKPDFNIVKQTFFLVFGSDWGGYLRYFYHILRPSLSLSLSLVTIFLLDLYVRKKKEALAGMLLFFFIVIDLFYFGTRFYTAVKPGLIFPPLDSAEFLKKDKTLYRAFTVGDTFVPNTLMPYGIQSEGGFLSLFPGRYEEFWGLIDKKVEGVPFRVADYSSRLLDLLNVKYFLGAQSDGADEEFMNDKFELAYSDKQMRIYKNKSCMSRAFWARDFKVIREKKAILSYLGSAGFEPDKTVILEEEPDTRASQESGLLTDSPASVAISDYSADSAAVDVDAPAAGFLVMGDSYYPGWNAKVDGRGEKIYRADYLLRAVFVPQGRHRVEFSYQPLSFKFGLCIAALTLLGTLSVIAVILVVSKVP